MRDACGCFIGGIYIDSHDDQHEENEEQVYIAERLVRILDAALDDLLWNGGAKSPAHAFDRNAYVDSIALFQDAVRIRSQFVQFLRSQSGVFLHGQVACTGRNDFSILIHGK